MMHRIATTLSLAAMATATALGVAMAAPALARVGAKNNAAIKSAHTVNDGGARTGANSFTERQARAHIGHAGFSDVSTLAKNGDGIWRGSARRAGATVRVALDFKGNVTTGR